MNRLISLIKVGLKCGPADNNLPNSEKSKKKNIAIQVFFIIFLFVFVAIPFGGIGYGAGEMFKGLGINIYKLIIPTISIAIPLLTLAFVLSNLFLNNNDETYLALPITPKEIYTSRLVTSIIQSYLFIFMFFAPALFGLLIGIGAPFDTYLSLIVFIAISPIVPVAFVAFLFTLLSKVINFKKHRGVLNIITMIFPILIILGMQFLTTSTNGDTPVDPNEMLEFLQNMTNSIGNILCLVAFPSIPSVISFSSSNVFIRLGCMLVSIVTTLGIGYLLILLSNKLYYPYLLNHEGNKSNNNKVKDKDYKTNSSLKSLMFTDFKEIIRSPILSMNFIFPLIMMPIIMLISFFVGAQNEANIFETIQQLKVFIDFNNPLVITIIVAIVVFFSSMSFASITSISRLGKNSFFVKMIPVKPIKVILSRVMFGFFSSLLIAFLLIVVFTGFGLFDILNAILILLTIIPIIMVLNLISISLDLWKPYLTWNNENELMKNSVKTAMYMIVCWIGAGIFVGIGFLFYYFIPQSGYILLALIMLSFTLVCFLMYKHLNKDDIFDKI